MNCLFSPYSGARLSKAAGRQNSVIKQRRARYLVDTSPGSSSNKPEPKSQFTDVQQRKLMKIRSDADVFQYTASLKNAGSLRAQLISIPDLFKASLPTDKHVTGRGERALDRCRWICQGRSANPKNWQRKIGWKTMGTLVQKSNRSFGREDLPRPNGLCGYCIKWTAGCFDSYLFCCFHDNDKIRISSLEIIRQRIWLERY